MCMIPHSSCLVIRREFCCQKLLFSVLAKVVGNPKLLHGARDFSSGIFWQETGSLSGRGKAGHYQPQTSLISIYTAGWEQYKYKTQIKDKQNTNTKSFPTSNFSHLQTFALHCTKNTNTTSIKSKDRYINTNTKQKMKCQSANHTQCVSNDKRDLLLCVKILQLAIQHIWYTFFSGCNVLEFPVLSQSY